MARSRQVSRDEVIRKCLEDAPGSVTARALVDLADDAGQEMPISAVRDSLGRLMAAGQAFKAGERRGRRYGSTQEKADQLPTKGEPAPAEPAPVKKPRRAAA